MPFYIVVSSRLHQVNKELRPELDRFDITDEEEKKIKSQA